MADRYFHFTLGPVQGFVSQARRTRDFWAGSFLLSWLSGVAMAATEASGGKIDFPIPAPGYLDWIRGEGEGKGGKGPRIGAIPNRFMAKVPAGFQGEAVAQAVRHAWLALAEAVWRLDLEKSGASRAAWERQHQSFWEISWVLTDGPDSAALDRRKNWRNHLPPAEPGVKCMLMEGLQELSGIEAMDGPSNAQRRKFWNELRTAQGHGGKPNNSIQTDLNEGEMLCAIAYVKRRFVRVFNQDFRPIIGLGSSGTLTLQGWTLDHNMPSTAYMAAVHWLEALVGNANPNELAELHRLAGLAGAGRDEWDTRIHCLETALDKQPASERPSARQAIALDGNIFFEPAQEAPQRYGFNQNVREVRQWLKAFWDTRADKKPPLSPFYAVLMMDGDSLGAQMSDSDNQAPIATALNGFTQTVEGIVYAHNGVLIYAGGDDVLALLPLEDALKCAAKLRGEYMRQFQPHPKVKTSLSGAVIFAHVKTALGEVLRQAHLVLDEVAKDGAGRDAIAVRVLKPGGDHLTWAQPWEVAMQGAEIVLNDLATQFQKAEGKELGEFSSKFFYKMRQRFEVLQGMSESQITSLLAADYLASEPAQDKKATMKDAREKIAPLVEQCIPRKRDSGTLVDVPEEIHPKADAALLLRFLANKGVEAR